MSFSTAIALVLAEEGGYVNDPRDPGGETKFGICRRSYPDIDIADLTADQAGEIYRRDFWDRIRGDDLPAGVAIFAFDTAVNLGMHRASVLLQRAAGTAVDGIVGPQTVQACFADPVRVLTSLRDLRQTYYQSLSTFATFGRGWTARVDRVYRASLEASHA